MQSMSESILVHHWQIFILILLYQDKKLSIVVCYGHYYGQGSRLFGTEAAAK